MIRIYLDTNIYSKLKNEVSLPFIELKKIFQKRQDAFLFNFSKAHLLDLVRDETDQKYSDLNFMAKFAKDNFIKVEREDDSVRFLKINPRVAFETQINHEYGKGLNLTSGLNELVRSNPLLNSPLNSKMPGLSGFMDKIPLGERKKVEQVFPINGNASSLNDLISSFQSMYNDWNSKGGSSYKELRKFVKSKTGINEKVNIVEDDFDQQLKDSPLGKTLFELVEMTINNNKSIKKTRYNFFLNSFLTLNIFGLDNEKAKKVHFMNTLHDAQHAFYAAHCDILITEDDGLLSKARALYKSNNIQTQVYSCEKFLDKYPDLIDEKEKSAADFFRSLNYELGSAELLQQTNDEQDKCVYEILKSKYRFLGYFNRIQRTSGSIYPIILCNNSQNYSSTILFEEIKSVVNRCIELFGADIYGKTFFESRDLKEINEGVWDGRHWRILKEEYCGIRFNSDVGRFHFIVDLISNLRSGSEPSSEITL